MKRLYAILTGMLAAVLLCTAAAAAVIPDFDSELLYVTDTANILSADTENYIADQNDILYAATGAQFAVLTVETLPAGYDSESYCYEVFNAWGVGDPEKNNGILLLLVPNEGKFWMVTGYGLQSHLTGGTVSALLDDYLAEDFDAGRYDAGLRRLFDAVWEELELIYGDISAVDNTAPENSYQTDHRYDEPEASSDNSALVLLILFIIIIAVILIALRKRPGKKYYKGTVPPPPPPGNPPYYRTYTSRRVSRPVQPHRPLYRPMRPPLSGMGGFGTTRPPVRRPTGSFGGSRPTGSRPTISRPSGSFGSSRSGSRSSSFGGGSSRSSFGGSRSFGGGRSHGGGGGRR
ncbi:MAG: TPM domain-containing protein [Oscillospiraceae bacterium]|nr:TPM domain-containing protein [Oscillospiraceae bacterium]